MNRGYWIFSIFLFILLVYGLFLGKDKTNELNPLDEKRTNESLNNLSCMDDFNLSLRLDNETTPDQEIYDNYPNIKELHWGHMPLKYFILNPQICGNRVVDQIIQSFDIIENETDGIISFERVYNEEDISVECFDRYDPNVSELVSKNTYADSGVNYVFDDGVENVAAHGQIRLFKVTPGSYYGRCGKGYPVTIIHEILHLFGFEDTHKGSSIMYLYVGLCLEKIDKEIITQLKETYTKKF